MQNRGYGAIAETKQPFWSYNEQGNYGGVCHEQLSAERQQIHEVQAPLHDGPVELGIRLCIDEGKSKGKLRVHCTSLYFERRQAALAGA